MEEMTREEWTQLQRDLKKARKRALKASAIVKKKAKRQATAKDVADLDTANQNLKEAEYDLQILKAKERQYRLNFGAKCVE